jgi:hypothetical protein
VPNQETPEMFAFMDAAQKSKEQGGKAVELRWGVGSACRLEQNS